MIREILFILLAVLLLLAAPAAANAVADGDFESGALSEGWSAEANVTVVTGDVYNGTYAVDITSLGSGDPLTLTYDGVNFSGAAHNLSFAIKITGASSTPYVKFSAAPFEGEWSELYSTTTKTDAWQIVEVDTDSFTGLYSIIWEVEPTGSSPSIVLIDSVTTDQGAYVASFTAPVPTNIHVSPPEDVTVPVAVTEPPNLSVAAPDMFTLCIVASPVTVNFPEVKAKSQSKSCSSLVNSPVVISY